MASSYLLNMTSIAYFEYYDYPQQWADAFGHSCADYKHWQWCENGNILDSKSTEEFEEYQSWDNITAIDACYDCGGGIVEYDNKLNVSIHVSRGNDFSDNPLCYSNVSLLADLEEEDSGSLIDTNFDYFDLYLMCNKLQDYYLNYYINNDDLLKFNVLADLDCLVFLDGDINYNNHTNGTDMTMAVKLCDISESDISTTNQDLIDFIFMIVINDHGTINFNEIYLNLFYFNFDSLFNNISMNNFDVSILKYQDCIVTGDDKTDSNTSYSTLNLSSYYTIGLYPCYQDNSTIIDKNGRKKGFKWPWAMVLRIGVAAAVVFVSIIVFSALMQCSFYYDCLKLERFVCQLICIACSVISSFALSDSLGLSSMDNGIIAIEASFISIVSAICKGCISMGSMDYSDYKDYRNNSSYDEDSESEVKVAMFSLCIFVATFADGVFDIVQGVAALIGEDYNASAIRILLSATVVGVADEVIELFLEIVGLGQEFSNANLYLFATILCGMAAFESSVGIYLALSYHKILKICGIMLQGIAAFLAFLAWVNMIYVLIVQSLNDLFQDTEDVDSIVSEPVDRVENQKVRKRDEIMMAQITNVDNSQHMRRHGDEVDKNSHDHVRIVAIVPQSKHTYAKSFSSTVESTFIDGNYNT